MSESENESRETVADIVAEMRDHVVSAKAWKAGIKPGVVMDFAGRIEAAAKRDEDHAVEHATRHAEAVARDNCRDCVHNPSGKNYEGGNAAAMREAAVSVYYSLEKLRPFSLHLDDVGRMREFNHIICLAKNRLDAAISAPPRNCDKMPDIDNLTMHDLAKSPCKSTLECASREELLALVRWLFAPAAERKGEDDGR